MKKSEHGPVRHRRGATFIESQRTPLPHFYCFRIAKRALDRGKSTDGEKDDFQIATVFSVFAAEAYFNYLGQQLVPYWPTIESASIPGKAEILHERVFQRNVAWDQRPYQTLAEAVGYRNGIAHGKTVTVRWRGLVSHRSAFSGPTVVWEKSRNASIAKRIVADVEALIMEMNSAAGHEDPFETSSIGKVVLHVPPRELWDSSSIPTLTIPSKLTIKEER